MIRCEWIIYSPAEGRIHIGKCYGDYDMAIRSLRYDYSNNSYGCKIEHGIGIYFQKRSKIIWQTIYISHMILP